MDSKEALHIMTFALNQVTDFDKNTQELHDEIEADLKLASIFKQLITPDNFNVPYIDLSGNRFTVDSTIFLNESDEDIIRKVVAECKWLEKELNL